MPQHRLGVNQIPRTDDPVFWRSRIALGAALAAVFAIKLAVLLQLKDHPLLSPDAGLDTTAYVQLARRVLAGDWGLGPGLYYVSPFYIYFLAVLLAALKSFTAVRLVQIGLGTCAAGGIFVMAREWFGVRAAWWALGFAAFTGLFTFFEILILQSSIDVFLTAAALCALTFALTRERPALFFVSGLVFGLMTLNRPNVLLAAGGIVLALGLVRRTRVAALLLAGIVAGMAPAAIRNVTVSHEFTFVSSHGGLNFYIGNGDGATGFYRTVPGINPTIGGQEVDTIRVASRALGHEASDAEASDYFFGLAWTWIREHPGAAAWLFVRKLYYVFNAGFTALPQSYPFYVHEEHTLLRYLVVGPWLLIPLGLLGLILAGIRRPNLHAGAAAVAGPPARAKTSARPSTGAQRTGYRVWLAFAPGYAISVAVFFVAERYRLPLLVALTVGAGAGADLLIQTIRARERRRLITAVAMLAVAAAGANWPLHLNDSQWIEGLRLAQRLSILGRETEALQVIPRIERLEPSPGATDYGVAEQLLDLKQPQEALPLLTQAQAKSPADPRFDFALGQALRQLGRAREALPHLRHGFEAGIELPQGGYDYAAALGEAGDDAGALAALQRINPGDDPDGWLRLGRLAVEIHAPVVAEPLFRRAVALRPDAASHQQLGLDLLLLERYEDASRELSDASRLDPRDAGTLSHLAYCDAKLGHLDAARTHAAQALAIDPSEPLARQLATALR